MVDACDSHWWIYLLVLFWRADKLPEDVIQDLHHPPWVYSVHASKRQNSTQCSSYKHLRAGQ